MEISFLNITLLSALILILGAVIAYFNGRKTPEFKLSEYFSLVIPSLICVCLYAFYIDENVIKLYLLSALTGLILEHGLGLVYHKVLNEKLWAYSRLSWRGYTSLLSIPFWGSAGVVFWVISHFTGL